MQSQKPYEAPQLRVLGTVHDLTQGSLSGSVSDGVFVLVKSSGGGTVGGSA